MTPLHTFLQKMKEKDIVINYVQVYQKGELLEEYQRMETKTRLNICSVSKSVTSLGAGIAIEEGLVTLDDRLLDFFPEYRHRDLHPNIRKITLRDCLTMTCGLTDPLFFADEERRYREKDWVDYFMKSDFAYEPGTHFQYSNFNTYMLGCALERVSGQHLVDYLTPRLFEPLHIGNPNWFTCPKGHTYAASALFLTIDEMAAIGKLLLQKGKWEGSTLVPEAYIAEATQNQVRGNIPKFGYGYHFWINPDGKSFRADGKYGQYIVVVPEKELMLVLQALDLKPFFQDVWEEVVVPYMK